MIELPTEKSTPSKKLSDYTMLIYGEPKVGKTTFASEFPNALFLLTTPAPEALPIYKIPILSWRDFIDALLELRKGDHDFDTVVVDTTDVLFDYCREHVTKKLGIDHPSDLDFGKGWEALRNEFQKNLARLCSLPTGTLFISHSDLKEIETHVGTRSKYVPTLTGQARKVVNKLTSFILYFRIAHTEDEGEVREVRTRPGTLWEAGIRTEKNAQLPDPLPMNYDLFVEAFKDSFGKEND